MDAFDTKWGNIPTDISEENNFYIITVTQFLVCFIILIALQPPFTSVSSGEDYHQPKPSIILILIVCSACAFVSASINNELPRIIEKFEIKRSKN